VHATFVAVGTSRAVTLTRDGKGALVHAIEVWAGEIDGGFAGLPDGIYELRNEMHRDLAEHPHDETTA
jgi:hypothetical protein